MYAASILREFTRLCLQGRSQRSEQFDGGLGSAFFDELDLVAGHADPKG